MRSLQQRGGRNKRNTKQKQGGQGVCILTKSKRAGV